MSGLAMDKPWVALTAEHIGAVPAQLGVFEIADADGVVLKIGYAGGREMFGLRSALDQVLEEQPAPAQFRYELTHGYLTRWEELLMVYKAQQGHLPAGNADHPHKIGHLTVT